MVGIVGSIEIRQVTRDASSREPGKHAVFVALGARSDIDMSARQGERRIVVVERRSLPAGCSVTQAAVLRESGCLVVWIGSAVEIRQMARYACGRKSGKHIVFVTLLTSDIDVGAGQRKGCIFMVECRTLPSRGCVTDAAVLRKTCSCVVRIGRAVEIRQVTGNTRSRESGEHVVFMTLGARSDIDVSAC